MFGSLSSLRALAFHLLHFKVEGFEGSQAVATFLFGKGICDIFVQSKNR
jgi:hypothetical protein